MHVLQSMVKCMRGSTNHAGSAAWLSVICCSCSMALARLATIFSVVLLDQDGIVHEHLLRPAPCAEDWRACEAHIDVICATGTDFV